ncbi:MAG: VCBS repeat-containing protein, partial [Oscillibacter sp.]|nr:VCBS repeat-containing protein [Oscillibacter sp.]
MTRHRLAAALLLLLFTLSGCANGPGFTLNPQELYALPELPAKYTQLNGLLAEILSGGAEYAAPTSGSNIQSVQLIDLNGDGREEAVAFFRNPADEKPLKICIFSAEDDTYRMSSRIEGSGTAIYSINYVDMNGDGRMEIAVGWKAAAELQVLEVYTSDDTETRPLVRTDYVKYLTFDLNEDGQQELLVLRAGENGDGVADYYSWQDDGSLVTRSYIRISSTMAELSQQGRVRSGTLRNSEPAIYVSGVTDQSMAVTDILTLRGGEIANIV